jgi:AcrR family transcriptional regulator
MQRTSTKSRRTRNSLSQKEILDAAEAIVKKEGLSHLSMRRIADKLNCSVASPYAHFTSLEEICKGMLQRGEGILTASMKEALKNTDDTFDQLFELAKAYWKFAKENREMHKLMFNNGIDSTPLHRKALTAIPASYRIFLETIRKGMKTGEFNFTEKEYPAICRTLWSWIYGLIVLDLSGVLQRKRGDIRPLEEGLAIFKKLLHPRIALVRVGK